MMNLFKKFKVLAITMFIAITPFGLHAENKIFHMKAQSVYGPMSKTTIEGLFTYLDLVEKKSDGQIKFQRFSSGQLAKPKEALDAIEVGMYDVLLSYPSYYEGHVPEGQIFLAPFMFRSMKSITDIFYNTKVGSMLADAYLEKGSILIGLQAHGPNVITSSVPIQNLSDFKGKKIRGPGGLGNDTLISLGSSPVMLVGAEIYTALQRGTIDGLVYPLYSNYDYKFYEVGKYYSQPSLGYIVTFIWLSKKTYDKLTPNLQKMMIDAGKEHAYYMVDYAEKADIETRQKLSEQGMKAVELSKDDTTEMLKLQKEQIWPKYVTNERSKQIMKICLEYEKW